MPFFSVALQPLIRNGLIQRVVDKFNLKQAQYAYELQYSLIGNTTYQTRCPVVFAANQQPITSLLEYLTYRRLERKSL